MRSPPINPQTGVTPLFYDEALDVIHGFLERIERKEGPRTIVIAKGFFVREQIPTYHGFFEYQEYAIPEETEEVRQRVGKLDALVGEINTELKKVGKETNIASPALQKEYATFSRLVYQIGETVGAEHRHPVPA